MQRGIPNLIISFNAYRFYPSFLNSALDRHFVDRLKTVSNLISYTSSEFCPSKVGCFIFTLSSVISCFWYYRASRKRSLIWQSKRKPSLLFLKLFNKWFNLLLTFSLKLAWYLRSLFSIDLQFFPCIFYLLFYSWISSSSNVDSLNNLRTYCSSSQIPTKSFSIILFRN